MKIKNRGFTLIEVIIAMAIMTSIIFIGYQVINKTDILRRDQILVSNIQNGTNNLKRYITKELKESKSVYVKYGEKKIDLKKSDDVNNLYKSIQNEINNRDDIEYKYIINTKDKEINYIVQVIKDRSKKVYSIYRQEQKASFSLIEKQPLSNNMIPLKITEKDSLYDVQLNYIKDNTKVYSFDVYNSLLAYNDEDINKPTDPEDPDTGNPGGEKGHNYLSYCSQRIDKAFKEVKQVFNLELDGKLYEEMRNEIDDFTELARENNPSDKLKIIDILKSIESNIDKLRDYNLDKIINVFNQLNELEYYTNAAQITTEYLQKQKYELNNQNDATKIHDHTQEEIVPELQGAIEEVWNLVNQSYNLSNVHKKLHSEILATDMLNLQKNINDNIVNHFNPNKDITNQSKDIANDINNLIDKIIEQQIIIKDTVKDEELSTDSGDKALEHLDNAVKELIRVKYMLSQTNYHQQ
ncbi:type II secretion system protein [Paraclostridium bifermentans]|uniref:type II secretion system protein n=1 Tax=Paraclostridium bifermentans TaxID=1490 RepID=UPI00359C41D6